MNLTKMELIDKKNTTSQGEASYRGIVEAPRGSGVKFKYDAELKVFVMGHELINGLTYPFDWGFLPSTLGEDGDPLDVMIMHDSTSSSGIVISSQIIGVLELAQREEKGSEAERNDRFFAVPVRSHREDSLNHIDQISKRTRQELEQFFKTCSALEQKSIDILGWHGPKHAKRLIDEGRKRFDKRSE
jgi:inorganic pyrophosphatase